MVHKFQVRVYYEDTDLAGIVYYANYLKFIERARTEYIRDAGIDQTRLKSEQGIVFAVRRVVADYLSPARFDDVLTVETTIEKMTGARLVLRQDIRRDDTQVFSALVDVAALSDAGTATRLPADIRRILS